jgi:copper chaperone
MSANTTGRFAVEGMHCNGCVRSVTGAVSRLAGVDKVDVSLENKEATVAYDASAVDPSAIVKAIEAAGFEARPI